MSPREIVWRFSRAARDPARRIRAARRAPFAARFTAGGDQDARARESAAGAARLLIPDPEGTRRRFAEIFPGGADRARRAAEIALDHRIDLFSRLGVPLGEPIDWHTDYLTARRWPCTYADSIDLRDGEEIGEVRTVWELNRHHHLVVLAKAAFLCRDERFAEEVVRQWAGWLDANPPLRGVNWASPLEIAIRVLNWTWCLAFLDGTKALSEAPLARLMGALQEQAFEIVASLSRFSSANNHLIGEAAALFVAGSDFPDLAGAARWRSVGRAALEREALLQIYEDGVGKEQAPHYLAFLIDFYAAAAAAARGSGSVTAGANGRPGSVPGSGPAFPSHAAAARIGLASEFLANLRNEAGDLPAIGDSDEGRAVGLFAPGEGPYAAAIREGAHLAGRPDVAAGLPLSEQAFWLLGEDAARTAPARRLASRAFRSGGYAVLRGKAGRDAEGEVLAVFDAGELGYLSLAAHGHADALSLAVSVAGRWLLADPGTYCYHRSWPWRCFFKGTAAHNTLVVDGRNQSEIAGPSLWGRRAHGRLTRWTEGEGYVSAEGEHDGYAALADPVIHRRQVVLVAPETLLVIDRLEGNGTHEIAAHFQSNSGVAVAVGDDGAVRFSAGGASVLWLRAAPPAGGEPWIPRAITGRESPPLGWTAPRFGARLPTPAVEFAGRLRLPCTLAWVLSAGDESPGPIALQADGAVVAERGGGAIAVAPDGSMRMPSASRTP